jgi:hypothetical protein
MALWSLGYANFGEAIALFLRVAKWRSANGERT